MTVKVVSVREADGGGAVILTFEISTDGTGGESERRSLLLTLPQYREHRLRRGDTVTTEEFDELETMSKTAEATRRGAGILAYGANSRSTLRCKLISKGFSREASDAAVAALADEGLIDEKKAALREAERCVAALRGRKYISARLFSLGYRGDATEAADEYMKSVDFPALCTRFIEKKYGCALPDEPHERDRAVAALMRRGFSGSDIREATRKLGSHK